MEKSVAANRLRSPGNLVTPVAYLCVGYPVEFRDRPMLEEVGWESRTPLEDVVFEDGWGHGAELFR